MGVLAGPMQQLPGPGRGQLVQGGQDADAAAHPLGSGQIGRDVRDHVASVDRTGGAFTVDKRDGMFGEHPNQSGVARVGACPPVRRHTSTPW